MKHFFIIILAIFVFGNNKTYCQPPFIFIYPNSCSDEYIGAGDECPFKNSAVLAKAFIEVLGLDFVKKILDDNIYFNIVYNINDCGFVINTYGKQNNLGRLLISQQTLKDIEVALQKDSARFQVCYYKEFINEDESIIKASIYKWHRRNGENIHMVRVYSLIVLIDKNYYEVELKKNPNLTKYDYLLMQIEKYLGNDSDSVDLQSVPSN